MDKPISLVKRRGQSRNLPVDHTVDHDHTERPAFVLFRRFPPGRFPWHSHRRAQLLHVSDGVLTIRTDEGLWVTPPHRAVWVLPGIRHCVESSRPFDLCTLYVEPRLVALPKRCSVVEIDSLVSELLLAASKFGPNYTARSAQDRLVRVVLDRLPVFSLLSLHLPEPIDSRLRRITEALQKKPSDARQLAELAEAVGMSGRTAARLFQREINMSFGRWRQQLRLLVALERLGYGESVTNVALEVGYADVSAFIAMFKSALGATPAQYFSRGRSLRRN